MKMRMFILRKQFKRKEQNKTNLQKGTSQIFLRSKSIATKVDNFESFRRVG